MTEVERICLAALDRPAGERAAFLADACHGDDALRHDIESLLAHASSAEQFIEQPAVAGAGALAGLSGLSLGQRLGPYHIVARLGAGGMGEVYRARDTQLGREVAIKILPVIYAADPERLARFEREARVLASLNHPHIAAVYGLEAGPPDAGPQSRALVMELVEGPTLADRIADSPLRTAEALTIARQIAEALEAAHEKGIAHRDLKPANIKITPHGVVKVLDFGLAKLVEPGGAGDPIGRSQSPTVTGAEMTHAGIVLGTGAYMSPEQATGKAVDRRTDIFAFGAVLYELLTGRRAFEGESLSEVQARVLEREPDWSALPPAVPTRIRDLLHRCLEKDPRQRRRDIGDVRLEIEQALSEPAPPVANAALGRRWRFAATAAIVMALAAGLVTVLARFDYGRPADTEKRLDITTPPTTDPASIAISPDGQTVVFAAITEGRSRLWLRPLATTPRLLAGTDGAVYPFWAPDNRSLGFFADGKLKRIDTMSGSVQELAPAPEARGGAWNRNDTILFVPSTFGANAGDILSVSATGGETVTVMSSRTLSARFPQFLPDGRHFIFGGVSLQPESSGLYVGRIGEETTEQVLPGAMNAVYASSGHLLFVRQGTLFAQEFDPARLAVTGTPFPVTEQVSVEVAVPASALSASAAGPIIYRSSVGEAERRFVWFDRSGNDLGALGDAERDDAATPSPSVSLDGQALAVHRRSAEGNGNWDIWLLEIGKGTFQRFTADKAIDLFPIWSPDGSRIVFRSFRTGAGELYEMRPSAGLGTERLLLAAPATPTDWSADASFILYHGAGPTNDSDIWALPMVGDRKPRPIARTEFEESNAQFSPDGKWIAYQSNESGRYEIYVQPFPGPGRKELVSTNGGVQVRWRRDGSELFYIAFDGRLMGVPIRPAADGSSFEKEPPVELFMTLEAGSRQGVVRPQYAVSADGQRFLMNTITREATSPITIILNWNANRD